MDFFAKIVNHFQRLAIFAERPTLDVRLGPKYPFDGNHLLLLEMEVSLLGENISFFAD